MTTGRPTPTGIERRSNLVLRALVDEMLDRIREVNRNSTTWTDADLARAEAELEALMARVRKVATQSETQ